MGWNPLVAAQFSQEPPKTLAEAALRYQKLFTQVNDAWNAAALRAAKAPARLGDADRETLRQFLYGAESAFGLDRAKTELADFQKNSPPPVTMVLAVEEEKQIGNVKVHIRGNHLTLGDDAPRTFLRIVSGENQTPIGNDRSGRLELAEWLVRPEHPLTSRVLVNRIWNHHFGEGIVRSPDNFGKLGDRPTHPELLDWLSKRFVESGWSIKAMHRLMLLSSSYQMSTAYNAGAALADPENRLLWRANRRRVEVEALRDAMLAVSGKLDRTMGGTLLGTPNFGYVTNDQSGNGANYEAPRRSVYLPVIRNAVFDVFQVFDFVEPSVLNGKRASTTIAPQALFLMNGQFVLQQSRAFAERLLAAPAGDDAARINQAYLQAYSRPAAGAETAAVQAYLRQYEQRLAGTEPDASKRRAAAWQSFCQLLFASSEFVYIN